MKIASPATIDAYITGFPEEVQMLLQQVIETVRKAAPDATESISYAIPTFKLNGKNLVHFAAFKAHIGFYATPQGHVEFEKELSEYKQGKGSVQFPFARPVPLDLIRRIVKFRVVQASEKVAKKKQKNL